MVNVTGDNLKLHSVAFIGLFELISVGEDGMKRLVGKNIPVQISGSCRTVP